MDDDSEDTKQPRKPFVIGKSSASLAAHTAPGEAEAGIAARSAMDALIDRSDAMLRIEDLAAGSSGGALHSITEQIRQQEKNISALTAPFRVSVPNYQIPKFPPNPILETNKRLGRIEAQFESMQTVAIQAAQIATSLQTYAADFLSKFEAAAKSTDKSANSAVKLSKVAIALTVLTALAPFAYQLWRAPTDEAANASVIAQLREEIQGLKQSQIDASRQLSKVLADNGSANVDVLKEIQDSLAANPARFSEGRWTAIPY